MSDEDCQPAHDRFPPMRRSVIEAARSIDAGERESALQALCAAYWKPIYKYVRVRWNRPGEEAQDLAQGFFVELLERELLEKFDASRSRLRTYLRLCVDSFVSNEGKAGRRQKHHATYTFLDNDHFKASWTFRKDQKDALTEDVTYVRAK